MNAQPLFIIAPFKLWGRLTAQMLLLVTLVVSLVACASTPLSPQRPDVTVVAVKPVSLSGNEQRFLFTLNLNNPNSFSLPVEVIDVVAGIAGEQVATGQSTTEVSVPAGGDALVDIEIVTHLKDLFGKFLKSVGSGNINLDYKLNGDVKIKNVPKTFNFESTGNLLDAVKSQI